MSTPALTDVIIPQARIPRATYRLQFNAGFTFQDAEQLVPYLAALGISDLYASPILLARPGSQHGYDVCDPSQINPELGTPEDFDRLSATLQSQGLGLLLDIVPNHMGVHSDANLWWNDVLENGPSSIYAQYFDIDWHPIKAEIANKILLPILSDHYGKVLEQGELRLIYHSGAFWLQVADAMHLPIAPRTYRMVLAEVLPLLRDTLGGEHADVADLESIITALHYLPPPEEITAEKITERYREKEVVKRRIATLYDFSGAFRRALDATVERINGSPGVAASFDLLEALIAAQCYRPAFWRVASEEINYRRFFDINALAAIHVEHAEVFYATHARIFDLLDSGKVTGLRIDHPDGLWNPGQYFRQLQDRYLTGQVDRWQREQLSTSEEPRPVLPGGPVSPSSSIPPGGLVPPGSPVPPGNPTPADGSPPAARTPAEELLVHWRASLEAHYDDVTHNRVARNRWPLYIVVEKILTERELLPADWPVFGTTGYDFMSGVNDLFVAHANERDMSDLYASFIERQPPYATIVISAKRLIMNTSLTSEINALGYDLERITERNRRYRDYTLNSVIYALREVITHLDVYRTYTAENLVVSERDQLYIQMAIAEAKRHNNRIDVELYDFLQDTLLLRNLSEFREADRQAVINFVMKFQQVTGPIMAKSLEDTAFYTYNRLVSLNEVGDNPEQFGTSVTAFHDQNAARWQSWPHALLATSTHDTKRSEDVRARINVISECPQEWEAAITRWHTMLLPYKVQENGGELPTRNDEYLLYQTLMGIWPDPGTPEDQRDAIRARVADYMVKAAQEAKTNTSWINPNAVYLQALRSFVDALFAPATGDAFMADFLPLQRRIAWFGRFNALSQTLLKMTAPGVPDLFQGMELWNYSLVDPDNRRPVHFAARSALLAEMQARTLEGGDLPTFCQELVASALDGRVKLYTIWAALALRQAHERIFADGDYRPIVARGDQWQHVCAFAREIGDAAIITIAPILIYQLCGGEERAPIGAEVWGDTWLTLPDHYVGRQFRDGYSGAIHTVAMRDGVPGLTVANMLDVFPVALLAQVE